MRVAALGAMHREMNVETRHALALDDGEVSYLEWPGPPGAPLLLFQHANGFNAQTYRFLLSPLADRFRIVAQDLRGHGQTTLPPDLKKASWRIYADDLLRFLDRLGARPNVLAGHSMGATTGLMAVARRPEMAQSLVLAEPVMQPDTLSVYAFFARTFGLEERLLPLVGSARRRRAQFASREDALKTYRGRGAFRSWPEQAVADYVESGVVPEGNSFRLACSGAWEGELYSIFPLGLAQLGKRVAAPVTILAGTEQSATTDPVAQEFARLSGRAKITRIPGASHFLPMEKPEIVQAEILKAAGFPAPAHPGSP